MADYYPLISRAVAGLDKNNGENRRALYERARAALLAQLRGVTPALPESDITRERLALEESIRKVEAEASRQFAQTRSQAPPVRPRPPEPRPEEEDGDAAAAPAASWKNESHAPAPGAPASPRNPPAMPKARAPAPSRWEDAPRAPAEPPQRGAAAPAARQDSAPAARKPAPASVPAAEPRYADAMPERSPPGPMFEPPPVPPPAPRHPLRRPAGDRRTAADAGVNDFRNVVSEANELGGATARAAKSAREAYDAVPTDVQDYDRREARLLQPEEARDPHASPDAEDFPQPMLEPSFTHEEVPRAVLPRNRKTPSAAAEADYDESRAVRPARSYRELIRGLIAAVVLIAVGGLLWWQWPKIVSTYRAFRTPATDVAKETPPAGRQKIPDRLEPGGQVQPAPNATAGAGVAQKVVLYEEDPADPNGKRFVGSAVWRTETVTPGPGQPPELAIRADVEVPERKLAMTWSLRRNTDKNLPASHTVEVMFKLPADFPAGGIANVPGILMKQSESTRGVPLAGLAVKVTTGFFLIGLSAVDADRERNIALLKERAWFDIPVVYNNNRRAILAMEKGTPGDKAFADAFKAWKQ